MPDREKVEEWARDFMAYIDELDITRDDYRGIMEYIDDALTLIREQAPEETRFVRRYSRPGVFADLWLHCEECG